MDQLSQEEIRTAFITWSTHSRLYDLDRRLRPYLNQDIQAWRMGSEWLTSGRHALQLTTKALADKLQTEPSTYGQTEERERQGSITLAALAKAAGAMDCELVYAIRPKNRVSYSERLWPILKEASLAHPWLRNCDPQRRGAALAAIARDKLDDPAFRRAQGWSKRLS